MRQSVAPRKISWFFREDELGTLDLSPDFQRRPVWSDEQASYLIDTILQDLPFPEVYVRSMTSASGTTNYQVVDGQQRVRSILDFAKNDLVLCGGDVSAKWLDKSFEDLGEDEKAAFWKYTISVRELEDASDADIRDMFRRLNINSMVLNDQELRHATYTGQFLKLMERLADDEWWIDSGVVTIAQVRRMLDVEYISELFIALMAGPQDKKKTLDAFYGDFDLEFPEEKEWMSRFRRTRDLVDGVLEPKQIRRWSGKSDFYTLFSALGSLVADGDKPNAAAKKALQDALMQFRDKVDQAKKRDNKKKFAKSVHDYADAVTRAATDVARRETRLQILEKVIKDALA